MARKYTILQSLLSKNEAAELLRYAESIVDNSDSGGGVVRVTLSNRPDSWDSTGYIERGLAASSGHFQSDIFPTPLDRVGFYIRRVSRGGCIEPIVELDLSRDAQIHQINRKIGILALNEDYMGGTTVFNTHGESVRLGAGDLLLYEVDELNKIEIQEVTEGQRVEIIYMYMEVIPKTRFDEFYMPPMENDSDRF